MLPDGLHFLRPYWLWLLPVIMLISAWWWRNKWQTANQWEKVCDAHLLQHLSVVRAGVSSRWPLVLASLCAVLLTLALAGPAWERLPQPVYKSGGARVLILDLSESMNSPDLAPSRLQRARYKLLDILSRSADTQVGLVVYADDAFVVSPLTHDADTIAAMVPSLETGIMPVQGDRVARALRMAAELLANSGMPRGEILLITDGVGDQGSAMDTLAQLVPAYRLSVLAVGTEQGAPIPLAGGGFVQDRKGQTLMPRLPVAALQDLARIGGGYFARLSGDDQDLDQVLPEPETQRDPAALERADQQADIWREEGPWLVLLVLPLLALLFRRGWLAVVVLVWMVEPQPVHAFSWQDLWLRTDQQASRALQAGDAERAASQFEDPAWKATAAYRAGDYTAAVEQLSALDSAESHYNRGNALARAGDLKAALAAYQQALQQQPGLEDAEFNRQLVEQLLQQQEQQQKQQQSQDQSQAGDDSEQSDSGQGSESESSPQDGQTQPAQADADGAGAGSEAGQDEAQNEPAPQPQSDAQQTPAEEEAAAGQESAAEEGDEAQQAAPATTAENAPESDAGNGGQTTVSEADQALEQWLRGIPDQPGGLLKQKLIIEHLRRQREQQ